VSTAKVSATAYVSALCQAVAPFEKDVQAKSGALNSSAAVTATKGKQELVGYLGALSSDSNRAVTRLRAAGVPTVSGGAAFAGTILTTFSKLNAALSRSEHLAAALPTANEADFQKGASTLAVAVKDSIGKLGAGLSTSSNKALDSAAAKLSVCHSL
jgi:hypothetical protein